jgi:hypothetical protein
VIPLVLALLLATIPVAGQWILGITSFNNPKRLTMEPEPGTAVRLTSGTRSIVLHHGNTAGLLATGNEIDVFAQRVTSTGHQVRVTGLDGGPAKLTLRDSVNRRRYTGVLEVTASGNVLLIRCRVPGEVAPPASQPRHRGFDFCDQAHCGFSSAAPRP